MSNITLKFRGRKLRSPFRINSELVTVSNCPTKKEMDAVFKLRADIFCRELGWVGKKNDMAEIDSFDQFSSHIVASIEDEVVGYIRVHPKFSPWMTPSVFGHLIPENVQLHSIVQADVSRLAVVRQHRGSKNSEVNVSSIIFHALYRHCIGEGIQKIGFVVSKRVLKHLIRSKLCCSALSTPILSTDRDAPILAVLDWDTFQPEINWLFSDIMPLLVPSSRKQNV